MLRDFVLYCDVVRLSATLTDPLENQRQRVIHRTTIVRRCLTTSDNCDVNLKNLRLIPHVRGVDARAFDTIVNVKFVTFIMLNYRALHIL